MAPATPARPGAPAPTAGLARFLRRVGRLKTTPRTGWLDRGVPAVAAESVADHSYRTALLAWLAAGVAPGAGRPGAALDADRVLQLALIHDLPEALTGDPPPYDPDAVPTDAAARRRFLDGRHVRAPDRAAAKRAADLAALWAELAAGESAEARFVKQADKLETFLQSRDYLAADPIRPMASFAAEVAAVVTDPTLAALRDAVTLPEETEERSFEPRDDGGAGDEGPAPSAGNGG